MSAPLTERSLWRVMARTALLLFGLFLAWRFLAEVATLSLMVAMGVLLAVALSGPVEALRRRKVPRTVSSVAIVAGALGSLGLGLALLFPVLQREARLLVSELPDALSYLNDRIGELAGRLGLNPGGGISSQTLAGWGERLLGGALGLFNSVTSALIGLVIVLFLGIYLASYPEPVLSWIERLFPPQHRCRVRRVLGRLRSSLLDWLKGRLLSMAVVAVLSVGALYLIGIPGAFSLGILAGLVSFVPYFGPLVSVIPPALIGLASDPIKALWVILAYAAIQQVESYLITPLIMERAASLHPAVVIVSITVLGAAFGILGTLLALPAAVVAGVLVEELWFRRLEEGR
jgi:predicted PurR-regulated permease PerM